MNKWTDEEKDFIIEEYKSGNSIEKIFKMGKIKRSKYAIECKLYGHIYDLLQNGKSHSSVAKEFNKTKDEIKEIEKKAFEMKNQSENKTVYTGNGGYKPNSNVNFDLNEFHHINRSVNTVLCFYENIERLNKLSKSNIIDNDFYTKLLTELNNFTFDKEKFINSLHTIETSEPEIEKVETIEKVEKMTKKSFDEDDDNSYDKTPTKKYMKRL